MAKKPRNPDSPLILVHSAKNTGWVSHEFADWLVKTRKVIADPYSGTPYGRGKKLDEPFLLLRCGYRLSVEYDKFIRDQLGLKKVTAPYKRGYY